MTQWTFTRLLWLLWKWGMVGDAQDRQAIASAIATVPEHLEPSMRRKVAETQARIDARKAGRA